jgi:hypothetical protein
MRRLLLCLAILVSTLALTGCDEVFYTGHGTWYGTSCEPEYDYEHHHRRHHRRDYGHRNHHVHHGHRRHGGDCY